VVPQHIGIRGRRGALYNPLQRWTGHDRGEGRLLAQRFDSINLLRRSAGSLVASRQRALCNTSTSRTARSGEPRTRCRRSNSGCCGDPTPR
jgi:hypothetical protein